MGKSFYRSKFSTRAIKKRLMIEALNVSTLSVCNKNKMLEFHSDEKLLELYSAHKPGAFKFSVMANIIFGVKKFFFHRTQNKSREN